MADGVLDEFVDLLDLGIEEEEVFFEHAAQDFVLDVAGAVGLCGALGFEQPTGGTLLVALSYMIHARLEPKHDTIRARLLVAFLALAQPLVRGWARYFTWLKFKRTPPAVIASQEKNFKRSRGGITKMRFWSENGHGRERLLKESVQALEDEGWNYSIDTGWKDWDLQIYGSF